MSTTKVRLSVNVHFVRFGLGGVPLSGHTILSRSSLVLVITLGIRSRLWISKVEIHHAAPCCSIVLSIADNQIVFPVSDSSLGRAWFN